MAACLLFIDQTFNEPIRRSEWQLDPNSADSVSRSMSSLFDEQTVLILVDFVIIMLYYYVLELNKMKFLLC